MKKSLCLVVGSIALVALTVLGGLVVQRSSRGRLDESAKSAPWYPLLGRIAQRPLSQGVYWCMVRREQPFAPCPDCVMVCHQSLRSGPPLPPDGVFVFEDTPRFEGAEQGAGEDPLATVSTVSIALMPEGVLINGKSIVDDADLHGEIVQALGRHLRQAEILGVEPQLSARLVASPGVRARSIVDVVNRAVAAGLQRIELGVEVDPVSIDLVCRSSSQIDVHLFETSFFGGPRHLEVLAGAEDGLRWFCEDASVAKARAKTTETDKVVHATLAEERWVAVHDNLARQRQMKGAPRNEAARSEGGDVIDEQEELGQVLLKVGPQGFAIVVDQNRLPAKDGCDVEDPAFAGATLCVVGAHPEEVVAMSDGARRYFADGEFARGRAEVDRIVAAYDFEALEATLEDLARRSGEDSLILVGIEDELPAALLGRVLGLVQADPRRGKEALFAHVITSTSRF